MKHALISKEENPELTSAYRPSCMFDTSGKCSKSLSGVDSPKLYVLPQTYPHGSSVLRARRSVADGIMKDEDAVHGNE